MVTGPSGALGLIASSIHDALLAGRQNLVSKIFAVLSRAGRREAFAHSSPNSLKKVLQTVINQDRQVEHGTRNVFIVIESIYSMDGDVAPIKEFIKVVDELLPCGNGYFMVDEAHATGVLGPRGAGVVQELGVQNRMFIRVHTFGKALASHGGR